MEIVSEYPHLRVAPQWEDGLALFEVVIEHADLAQTWLLYFTPRARETTQFVLLDAGDHEPILVSVEELRVHG
jgi:hypothetical protein